MVFVLFRYDPKQKTVPHFIHVPPLRKICIFACREERKLNLVVPPLWGRLAILTRSHHFGCIVERKYDVKLLSYRIEFFAQNLNLIMKEIKI